MLRRSGNEYVTESTGLSEIVGSGEIGREDEP